tara:strand:- start:20552 stop:21016 length:465 start_codon:yes stop_codon:yes gene_type:complete
MHEWQTPLIQSPLRIAISGTATGNEPVDVVGGNVTRRVRCSSHEVSSEKIVEPLFDLRNSTQSHGQQQTQMSIAMRLTNRTQGGWQRQPASLKKIRYLREGIGWALHLTFLFPIRTFREYTYGLIGSLPPRSRHWRFRTLVPLILVTINADKSK